MKNLFLLAIILLTLCGSMNASADLVTYSLNLTGPNEAPPNTSPGIGSGTVVFDLDLSTMKIDVSFSGLQGNTTVAHIHCCTSVAGAGTAGVASTLPSFPNFPVGVTAGTYSNTFDLTLASSYSAAFITNNGGTISGALNALLAGTANGKAYFNLHSTLFQAGEIPGFLQPVPVPGAVWLFGSALASFLGLRRKK